MLELEELSTEDLERLLKAKARRFNSTVSCGVIKEILKEKYERNMASDKRKR